MGKSFPRLAQLPLLEWPTNLINSNVSLIYTGTDISTQTFSPSAFSRIFTKSFLITPKSTKHVSLQTRIFLKNTVIVKTEHPKIITKPTGSTYIATENLPYTKEAGTTPAAYHSPSPHTILGK